MKKLFKISLLSILFSLSLLFVSCEETQLPTELPTELPTNPKTEDKPTDDIIGDNTSTETETNTANLETKFNELTKIELSDDVVYKITISEKEKISKYIYFNKNKYFVKVNDLITDKKANVDFENLYINYLESNFDLTGIDIQRTLKSIIETSTNEFTLIYSLSNAETEKELVVAINKQEQTYLLQHGNKNVLFQKDVLYSVNNFEEEFAKEITEELPTDTPITSTQEKEYVNIFKTGVLYQGFVDYDSTQLSSIEPIETSEMLSEKGIDLLKMASDISLELRNDLLAESVTLLIYFEETFIESGNLFLEFGGFNGSLVIYNEEDVCYERFLRNDEIETLKVSEVTDKIGMLAINFEFDSNLELKLESYYSEKNNNENNNTEEPLEKDYFENIDSSLKITSSPSIYTKNHEKYWVLFYVNGCPDCDEIIEVVSNYINREKNQYDYPIYLVNVWHENLDDIIAREGEEEKILNTNASNQLVIKHVPVLALLENNIITNIYETKEEFEEVLKIKELTSETNANVFVETEGKTSIKFDSINYRINDVYGPLYVLSMYYDTVISTAQSFNVETELVKFNAVYNFTTDPFTTNGNIGTTSQNTSSSAPFIYAYANTYAMGTETINFLKDINLKINDKTIDLSQMTPETKIDYWYSSKMDFQYGEHSGSNIEENSYKPDSEHLIKNIKLESNLNKLQTTLKYQNDELILELVCNISSIGEGYIDFKLQYNDGIYNINLSGNQSFSAEEIQPTSFEVFPETFEANMLANYYFKHKQKNEE